MSGLIPSPVDAFACTLQGVTATASDGRTAPLDQCAWAEVAPCGCMSGIRLAVSGDEVLLTVEQAQRAMSGSAAEAQRDRRNGSRMVLVMMADYRRDGGLLEVFQRDCTHDPKWGVAKPTRTIAGVLFTRRTDRRWDADGNWEVEKISGRWYLSHNVKDGDRCKWLSARLPEALELAAARITAATEPVAVRGGS